MKQNKRNSKRTATNKRKIQKWLIEAYGWYGATIILVAYFLASFDVISGDGLIYQLLNLTGAIGVVILTVYKRVTQSAVLNLVWAGIALVAVVSILTK